MKLALEFQPRDCWIGVYWEYRRGAPVTRALPDVCWWDLHIWLCLLPMCPLHIVLSGGETGP